MSGANLSCTELRPDGGIVAYEEQWLHAFELDDLGDTTGGTRATCPMHSDAKLSRIFTPRIRRTPIFNLQSEICNFTLPALS